MRTLAWAWLPALLMGTACSGGGGIDRSPVGTITVTPQSVSAKTTDPPFEVTVVAESSPAGAETAITVTGTSTGVVSKGQVSVVGGTQVKATSQGFSYVANAAVTDKADVVTSTIKYSCLKAGSTTLTYTARFKNDEGSHTTNPVAVAVTCTGPAQVDLLADFFELMGVPPAAAWISARVANETIHSKLGITSVAAYPDILAMAIALIVMSPATVAAAFNNTTFPCGQGQEAYTVCPADQKAFPDGETILLMHKMDRPVTLDDTAYTWTYGFVFDQDGDTSNNYQAAPEYPNDFYQDSDRWYEANYAPGAGWSLKVSDATGGTISAVSSAARIIFYKEMAVLAVPASELKVKDPKYRVTVFRHTGDYGINPPHDWSGDMEPPVSTGLQSFGAP